MAHLASDGTDARPRVVAGLRLLARVGSGGEGEVWEARDPHGTRRALKLIRPEFLPGPEELARRGAYLRRIDHPALVRVQRTGRLQGSSLEGWGFLEMDFVDGEPLGKAPADPQALERLRPLAEGLDALHRGEWSDGVPLVHRDVKPANLISRPDGEVVLVDCSTLRGTDATHLTAVGTPVFAAPEVMTGRVGPPADVYSFGVTIVALVTGARGDELVRLLAAPERLDLPETVGRALSPDPHARPRSCREVLDAGAAIDIDLLPPLPGREDWQEDDDRWPTDDPAEWPEDPEDRRGLVAPWLLTLAACVALVWAGVAGRVEVGWLLAAVGVDVPAGAWAPVAVLGALLLHVFAARLAGHGWAVTLLVPPVAWAWLLGERAVRPGPVRAWVRVVLLGVLVSVPVAAAADLLGTEVPGGIGGAAAAGALLPVLATVAARAWGVAAVLLRVLLAPAWVGGAIVLLAGALLALPVVALAGRAAAAARLAAGTVAGLGAFLGLQGRPRHRQPPDPRA